MDCPPFSRSRDIVSHTVEELMWHCSIDKLNMVLTVLGPNHVLCLLASV